MTTPRRNENGIPSLHAWVDGRSWLPGATAYMVRNPYDDTAVAEIHPADAAAVERAVDTAQNAFGKLRRMSRHQRAALLQSVVIKLNRNHRRFVQMLVSEGGKPRMFAEQEFERTVATFTWAAEEARRFAGEVMPLDGTARGIGYAGFTRREPVGTVLGITPFNFPLNLVAHKVAPALAVGNPVIIKPASNTPSSALLLAETVAAAGFPPGSLNVLPMAHALTAGLLQDERVKLLSFTGSPAIGWQLKRQLGKQRVVLELGGNAGSFVDQGADLDWAAERLALGGFAQAGQSCIAVQRIYVHRAVYDDFLGRLIVRAEATPAGNPDDEATVVGPLISEDAAERVRQWIAEAIAGGAKAACGNRWLSEGNGRVLCPTVLTGVSEEMRVCAGEAFAPLVTVTPVADGDEAVRHINASPFGLQAAVFSNDLAFVQRAVADIEAGGVIVNDFPTYRVDPMPYGGIKDSGLGKEGIRSAMLAMSEEKMVVIRQG